jgi:hypothetical protein
LAREVTMSTPEQRMRMAKPDRRFRGPPRQEGTSPGLQASGLGRYEVVGINEKYNKEVCDHLVELIEAGEYDRPKS